MRKILLFLGGIAGYTAMYSQALTPQVIASTGSTVSGGGVSLSYTIGEPVTNTVSASSTTLTQGFHQSSFEVVAIDDQLPDMEVTVYPVPMDQYLNVDCSQDTELMVRLYDAAGRTLLSSPVFTKQLRIDVQHIANGPYMLSVTTADGTPVKSFSVVKTTTH